jgi:phage/plasmid-like protein (TIGR03299 family)
MEVFIMFTKIKESNGRNLEDVMHEANHNFEVRKVPLRLPNGNLVPDKMATERTDTGAYLGTVGAGYQPVQPSKFYGLAESFMAETGAVVDKTLAIADGSIMGISFVVDTQEYLPGDPVQLNFLMMTSFNMRYSVLGRALSNRLACLNQLPSSKKLFDLKHTRYVDDRLKVAMNMIRYYNKEQIEFKDKMRMLTGYSLRDEAAINWFRSLLPAPKKNSKRSVSMVENQAATFGNLLAYGKGTNLPGVRGTAYGALNALTEFVNHERTTRVKEGKDPETVKWESTIFGSGANLMDKGLGSIIDMVKTEPSNKYVTM